MSTDRIFTDMPIRFFAYDYSGEEVDIREVSEADFLTLAEGEAHNMECDRDTVFANGARQMCLTLIGVDAGEIDAPAYEGAPIIADVTATGAPAADWNEYAAVMGATYERDGKAVTLHLMG